MSGDKILNGAAVELYNIWSRGHTLPRNGWLVARYDHGRRMGELQRFEEDEAGARAFAAHWNDR